MPQAPAHKTIGVPFIELQSVDSTNNYARSLLKDSERDHLTLRQTGESTHFPFGTAVFAHEQLQGRGQWGKTWVTEKSANIILSVIADPGSIQIADQFQLSAWVAVGIHDFFKKYAGEETKIKWPNDLYWQDRKAGGVLIEVGQLAVGGWQSGSQQLASRQSGRQQSESRNSEDPQRKLNWLIAGIGININQTNFPTELKNPVSLKQITGKNFNVVELAKELCEVLNKKYRELMENGFDGIYNEYLTHLYKLNQRVKLKKNNQAFEGVVKGVTRTGCLVVEHSFEEAFDLGSVEWVLNH